jgi:hypothetical protein
MEERESHEKDVSAKQSQAQKDARISCPDAIQERTQGPECPSAQGAQTGCRLSTGFDFRPANVSNGGPIFKRFIDTGSG